MLFRDIYNCIITFTELTGHGASVGDLSVGGIVGIVIAILTLGVVAGFIVIIIIFKAPLIMKLNRLVPLK